MLTLQGAVMKSRIFYQTQIVSCHALSALNQIVGQIVGQIVRALATGTICERGLSDEGISGR